MRDYCAAPAHRRQTGERKKNMRIHILTRLMNISLTHPLDEFNFNNIHSDESKMSASKIPEILCTSANEAKTR